MEDYITTSVVAGLLDISERQVRRLVEKGVLSAEKDANGHYRFDPVTVQEEYESYSGANTESLAYWKSEIDKADAEIKRYTADIRELELAEMRGEYHRAEFVADLLNETHLLFILILGMMPEKLAPLLAGDDDVSRVAGKIQDATRSMQDLIARFDYKPGFFQEHFTELRGKDLLKEAPECFEADIGTSK